MSDHLPVLKVRLFGGFSASYGEIPVSFGRNTTTKAMKLLQILLYHGDTGISREHKSWKQYLDYFVSSVAEVDRQDSPIQFNTENKTW